MKTKNILILALSLMAIIYAINLLTTQNNSTIDNHFVIYDTSTVQRIFLADKKNNTVDLQRKNGTWVLNGDEKPIIENIDILLKTMHSIEVLNPLAKSAYNNGITQLASNSVKVEIYQSKYRINIGGVKLFKHIVKSRVFYVGGPTANNMGTLMKSEDDDELYITHIPGFRGYLTERFKANTSDWLSHEVFSYSIMDIQRLSVEYPHKPHESYQIINEGNRSFKIIQLMNNLEVTSFDTLRVLEELAAFTIINYESLLDKLSDSRIDSIKQDLPARIVTVESKLGAKRKLTMYYRPNFEKKESMNGKVFDFDMDRLYAFVDNKRDVVSVQYFVIDNISRPLSFLVNTQIRMPLDNDNNKEVF
ncbi:MAG: hypothetical protein KAG64_06380 [Bacteroidales bacterium]|nr:hypothetical protein [Bacteroidales bacterium]